MNQTLLRRGPDDGGFYRTEGAGLAMRRLSIIDLGGGHQPIHNEDQSIWVVFNGEIYNYKELRAHLLERGHHLRTNSDTEVIVHLYEEYGDEAVHHLRGMFAFALWDESRKRGLMVRDRLGIKPLFYAEVEGGLVFGSEIKAVMASGVIGKDIDLQALDAYFTYTYIPAPLTIYRDVRKLEPGCMLVFEEGNVQQRRYWDLDMASVDVDTDEATWTDRFEAAIDDAVSSHLVSDVPVGAFLSGGVDSSLVVAMMSAHLVDPVETFTLGFEGAKKALIDERPLAAQVASRYHCKYHDYAVLPDFRDIVGEIVDAFDEPFADDSVIPSYYISQFTRQSVKVALSGLGGDEVFAGYQRYAGVLMAQRYRQLVPGPFHRGIVNPLVRLLPEPRHGGDHIDHAKRFAADVLRSPAERYLGFVSTLPVGEREELFAPDLASRIDFAATGRIMTQPYNDCGAPDDVTRALYTDIKTYLPEDILALSDRLSMWHSLEVRVPLVDHRLVELSAKLPISFKLNARSKKVLLKKIARWRLPSEVLDHRKQGFESPMAAWLRSDLAGFAREKLSENALAKSGIFNVRYVSRKLDEHMSGRRKNNKLLFSLIMFQEWYDRNIN
jgi:asparagine synthase (glutamine-hydrolysing)